MDKVVAVAVLPLCAIVLVLIWASLMATMKRRFSLNLAGFGVTIALSSDQSDVSHEHEPHDSVS